MLLLSLILVLPNVLNEPQCQTLVTFCPSDRVAIIVISGGTWELRSTRYDKSKKCKQNCSLIFIVDQQQLKEKDRIKISFRPFALQQLSQQGHQMVLRQISSRAFSLFPSSSSIKISALSWNLPFGFPKVSVRRYYNVCTRVLLLMRLHSLQALNNSWTHQYSTLFWCQDVALLANCMVFYQCYYTLRQRCRES